MIELKSARELLKTKPELGKLFAHLENTPATHTVKGMYVAGILETLDGKGVRRPEMRTQAFKDYPLRQYMELLLDAAITIYPQQPTREALVMLGRLAIPTFASSIVGSVIMGTVGRSWELALKCVSKGYQVSLKPGNATVANAGPGHVVLQLRNVWNFPDSYQVGVVEGLMEWCDLRGRVMPNTLSASDVDLNIEWVERPVAQRRGERRAGRSIPPSASAG